MASLLNAAEQDSARDLAQWDSTVNTERASVTDRQGRLDTQQADALAGRERELAPAEADYNKSSTALEQFVGQRPKAQPLPSYQPKPLIDANDYQSLLATLLAIGAIGGAASHGNWLGVTSTFNGALKGYLQGNKDRAAKEFEDYKTKFNEAAAKNDQANKEFEDALSDRKLTLNQKLDRVSMLGAKWDRQDMRIAAQQKSIDRAWQQLGAHQNALEVARSRHDNVMSQLDARLDIEKERRAAVQGPNLTPEAERVKEMITRASGGRAAVLGPLNSRFSSPHAIPTFNAMVDEMMHKNMSPEQIASDINQNGPAYQAMGATLRQSMQREAGVQRLTLAVQGMERKIQAAMQRYGLLGSKLMNQPMNAIRDKLGDGTYTQVHNELVAAARLYIEAVTMPGSNAQLHASSQQTADELISDKMSPDQILGAFRAFNDEIEVGGAAMHTINTNLLSQIGMSPRMQAEVMQDLRPEVKAGADLSAPEQSPVSIEDLVKKYGGR